MPLTDDTWTDANFVAGALCLDFANTLSGRGQGKQKDRFTDEAALRAWLAAAGLPHPFGMGEQAFLTARELRETVFAIFDAIRRGEQVAPAELATLNRFLAGSALLHRIVPEGGGYAWHWDASANALGAALGRIAWSAADLLTTPKRLRIRQCNGENCAWLFIDETKNRSRVWCDMAVCGNRAKARRFGNRGRGLETEG